MAISSAIGRKIKNYRIYAYADCILGVISSTLALIGIAIATIKFEIKYHTIYWVELIFWICWLFFSLSVIGLGIFTHIKNKDFDEAITRKDLRAPIR